VRRPTNVVPFDFTVKNNISIDRKGTYYFEIYKIYFAVSQKVRNFAVAFESESCKQEKHCEYPIFEKSPNQRGRIEHYLLSLECVCYIQMAYLQA